MFCAFKFSLYVNVLPYFGYFYENWAKLCAILWSRWRHLMLLLQQYVVWPNAIRQAQ